MAARARIGATTVLAGLALLVPLSLLGALIGTGMVTALGTAGHTALLGALAALALGQLPWAALRPFGSTRLQVLAQGATLAATFGAGNALLLPIGIPAALGRPDLVGPLFLGVALALLVDLLLAWRLFATRAFPADNPWPQGAAVGETILAAHEGGRRGVALLLGMGLGALGAMYRAPMLAFGLAFLAPPWPLAVFAVGLLVRGHANDLPRDILSLAIPAGDLMAAQIPQGLMLGAALAALGQLALLARCHRGRMAPALAAGLAAHLAIALLTALAGGLAAAMEPSALLLFVAFAGAAAFLHALVCGLAAMNTGWFPGLALAMLALSLGLALGFPPAALCLVVGLTAATGPGFIAVCQAMKAGEMAGGATRGEQALAALLAFAIAGAVVWWSKDAMFAAGRIPPIDHVYAIAIRARAAQDLAPLALWAIPGAALQLLGGPRRQLGILLATGLLLFSPAAGWALLVGLLCRAIFLRLTAGHQRDDMQAFAGGVIAGDALYGLFAVARR